MDRETVKLLEQISEGVKANNRLLDFYSRRLSEVQLQVNALEDKIIRVGSVSAERRSGRGDSKPEPDWAKSPCDHPMAKPGRGF